MAKINRTAATETYNALQMVSKSMGEDNDCSVIAIATVCQVSYTQAHETCKKFGRQANGGMFNYDISRAIKSLGFTLTEVKPSDFIRQYPKGHCDVLKNVTTHHPERFNKVWADGETYVVYCKGHVLAVVNGVNHDWTKGKAKLVIGIYKITK